MNTLHTSCVTLLLASSLFAQSGHDKLAPYAGLRWRAESPEVMVDNEWFALRAIDGIDVAEMIAFCKTTYDDKWRKRFGEDLVQVMTEMGNEPFDTVELTLVELESGAVRVIAEAAMTEENRRAIRFSESLGPRAPAAGPLAAAAWQADLDQLHELVTDRWSYAQRGATDIDEAFAAAREQLGKGEVTTAAFALAIQELLCRFGDGHAGVRELPALGPAGFLPLLLADSEGGPVAFRDDRSALVEAEKPFLVSIDGHPIDEWLTSAARLVPNGSPQLVRRRALRQLVYLQQLRSLRGDKLGESATIALAGADGTIVERQVTLASTPPLHSPWPPPSDYRELDGSVGYLRLARMDEGDESLDGIDVAMAMLRKTAGLIIDVRGNGGSSRAVLRRLLPYFLGGERSTLVNVAAYRVPKSAADTPPNGYLADRHLYPRDWEGWDAGEVGAIEDGAAAFQPQWQPAKPAFTEWHYCAVSRTNNPGAYRYPNPVVVLMNSGCFGATEILLGALQGRRNITLLGTPSAGASGRARTYVLADSGLAVRLSSMASFRPTGELYDGSGITPDVVLLPEPTDFLRDGTDSVLEAARTRLAKK